MKNRIICLLLAVIMCMACLAGCMGGGSDSGDTNNGGDSTNNGGNNNKPGDTPVTPDDGDGELEEGWWDNITYDSQSLIFQMTNSSNNQELPSGCERYLAGTTADDGPVFHPEHFLQNPGNRNEQRADAADLVQSILGTVMEKTAEDAAQKATSQNGCGIDNRTQSDHGFLSKNQGCLPM